MTGGTCVPNDLMIGREPQRLVVSGSNVSGKPGEPVAGRGAAQDGQGRSQSDRRRHAVPLRRLARPAVFRLGASAPLHGNEGYDRLPADGPLQHRVEPASRWAAALPGRADKRPEGEERLASEELYARLNALKGPTYL